MAFRVFLSSTRLDLRPWVDAVEAALLAVRDPQLLPDRNEAWGALPEAPVVASQVKVDETHLFVGIYGWRYGYVPERAKTSITEQELDRAIEQEKPIFCFLAEDDASPPPGLPEEPEESRRRLAALKARLLRDFVVDRFRDPEELGKKVASALCKRIALEALVTPERRRLRGFWKLVKSAWIEGVLHPSMEEARRIAISREERPAAVGRAAPPVHGGMEEDLPIRDLFKRANGKLLVLGPPAGGKTTEMLELTLEQGRLAWASPDAPIPVVFHLGSWRKGMELDKWMVDQLRELYDVSPDFARELTTAQNFLPLLDALDEVEPAWRDDCVVAINAFVKKRGEGLRLAVCCQTQVYEQDPPGVLHLGSAVALLPLSPVQIDAHLASRPELEGLRQAVTGSRELQQLAESPLHLHRLEVLSRGLTAEEVRVRRPEELAEAWVRHALEPKLPWIAPAESPGARRRPSRQRREAEQARRDALPRQRYRPAAARRSLAWLARNMAAHHRPLFQVERLQPSWLDHGRQVWVYALASRAAGGLLLVPPLAWLFRDAGLAAGLLLLGLLGGAVAGCFDAVALVRRPRRTPLESRRRRYGRAAARGLLITAGVILASLVAGSLWLRLRPSGVGDPAADAANLRRAAAFLGPLLGAVFGSRAAARDRERDIRIGARLKWRRWSWRGVRLGVIVGAVAGAALALAGILDPTLVYQPPVIWLVYPAVFAAAGALGGGVLGGLGLKRLERTLRPNRGTWLAAYNAGVVALATALAAAVAVSLLLVAFSGRASGFRPGDLGVALAAGLTLGVWAGLGFSGLDFVQHFTLRGVLALSGPLPARLVDFLDFAWERGLLKRTGGSYEFHDLFVRRYFADLTPPKS